MESGGKVHPLLIIVIGLGVGITSLVMNKNTDANFVLFIIIGAVMLVYGSIRFFIERVSSIKKIDGYRPKGQIQRSDVDQNMGNDNYYNRMVNSTNQEDYHSNHAEPKHSQGHSQQTSGFHFCPNCGMRLIQPVNFCPNCGARMR
mgnify:CR=1 FL=1